MAGAGGQLRNPRRAARTGRVAGGVLLAVGLGVFVAAGGCSTDPNERAPRRIDRAVGPVEARSPDAVRVLLISIDGLAPRLVARARVPTFERLAGEGTRAGIAETVVPSNTLPAHTSMLSGLPPRIHGVTWNVYRPEQPVRVTTVFTICARERLRCGLFAGKPKLAHLAEHEPGVERFAIANTAAGVLKLVMAYLRERDPDFVMVHLREVDLAGHVVGWDSEEQRQALESIDAQLGPFLEKVRGLGPRPLLVILTSDHGGHGKTHGLAQPEDLRIPWIVWGDGIPVGTLEERVSTMDTAPTVLAFLGISAPPDWVGRARFSVRP